MILVKYFRKLMGWCPMEDSIQKERKGGGCYSFGLEKLGQPVHSPASMQEGEVLKGRGLYRGYGIGKIIGTSLVISLILGLYSPAGSFFDLCSSLIPYLAFLAFILYNHTTVLLTPEKIIIRRHLFRSLVLRKENIVTNTISKNKGRSLRWPLRLLALATLAIQLPHIVENITRDLQMEAAPAFIKLSSVMVDFWIVAYVLVIYFYIFELTVPYQQILKITTRSNLSLEFYTEEPEDIMATLKNKSK
ncbi:hypothetical protein MSKOL_0104 [Methanosarcina sp. Kolksee]|uniref:DUF1673 family protein n=1 Tax=Methanosarcina sp. Kolksee TaxID=1434099 RepID=UPI000615D938|nr:DUF1673 family protein [Methanosarcina sp. Kolksee]AKB45881.1 hypothetical protein MSKOL_0104 [Methanosarcina sp. Kolksee]